MNRIAIPEYNMEDNPISGISELRAHLEQALNDPSLPFDAKLLDDVELQLTEENTRNMTHIFLTPLTQILKSTTQDPTPLLSLALKLLSPLSFTEALAVGDPPSLLTALGSPLSGANLLALAIIQKAANSPADATRLNTLPDVVEGLISCWMCTKHVGVAEGAAKVLGDVLQTDCDAPDIIINGGSSTPQINGTGVARRRMSGYGELWRLILLYHPNLSLIQQYCTFNSTGQNSARTTLEVTTSQGRLLRILPRLCTLNINILSYPIAPEVFTIPEAIQSDVGQVGLLQWAALAMVDKSDMLMYLNLLDFFEVFVSTMRVSARTAQSDTLIKKLLTTAIQDDSDLEIALRTLPNRTIEGESEPLRIYIDRLLD
ncbi:hypothetical protein QQS21_007691 [Conoideocrella luteorostrata]|uniref:DNA mismatch repair protein HSM3 N-terminal domain-containing protein n=1 Tax=Conoideocrella luteorostrata TaxID=1105319 RepID=A0AAJ0CPM0_9HYPO|nr:hypothetical protein QQS21_007691 [Conoideocrella luteorostrata]